MYLGQIYETTQGHIPERRNYVQTSLLICITLGDLVTVAFDVDDDDDLSIPTPHCGTEVKDTSVVRTPCYHNLIGGSNTQWLPYEKKNISMCMP